MGRAGKEIPGFPGNLLPPFIFFQKFRCTGPVGGWGEVSGNISLKSSRYEVGPNNSGGGGTTNPNSILTCNLLKKGKKKKKIR